MKVICAGFPKTGTKSLKSALSMLGYSVYDYSENMLYYSDKWKQIMDDGWNSDDFRNMYENIDAVCDAPACYFWDEILKAFPDAKSDDTIDERYSLKVFDFESQNNCISTIDQYQFINNFIISKHHKMGYRDVVSIYAPAICYQRQVILSTRMTEEEWLISATKQLEVLRNSRILSTAKLFSPTFGRILKAQESLERVVFGLSLKRWGESGCNGTMLRKKYREHNSYVANNAPKGRLLVFHCKEGWKPLCEFLHTSEPDAPFPHENKNGEMLARSAHTDPMMITVKKEIINTGLIAFFSTIIMIFVFLVVLP